MYHPHIRHSCFTFDSDFAQKLAAALGNNPSSGLTTINLANNPLEDRGTVSALIYFNVLIWSPF